MIARLGDMGKGKRWPASIYADGNDPDPRFTMANERTFLAWIRTSMALVAFGVALYELADSMATWARTAVALALLLAGLVCAIWSWWRWANVERALRTSRPLPGASPIVALSVALSAVTLALVFATMVR